MSSRGTLPPRPRRPATVTNQRKNAKKQPVVSRRINRILLGAGILMLAAAVIVFAMALTHSTSTSTTTPVQGKGPYISHPNQNLVAGSPIDGVTCGSMEGQTQHIHQQLQVVVDGQMRFAPAYVGFMQGKNCTLYWIHMHQDYPGIIHVEAPVKDRFTLGAFLDIWSVSPVDQSLLSVIEGRNPDAVVVNGKPYLGDVRAIPLLAHELITLQYGNKVVPQQPFDFSRVG